MKYVMKEYNIDKKTRRRVRVPEHPGLCTRANCSVDLVELNFKNGRLSSEDYEQLTDSEKATIGKAMEAHVERYHTVNSERIIDESQMSYSFLPSRT